MDWGAKMWNMELRVLRDVKGWIGELRGELSKGLGCCLGVGEMWGSLF